VYNIDPHFYAVRMIHSLKVTMPLNNCVLQNKAFKIILVNVRYPGAWTLYPGKVTTASAR